MIREGHSSGAYSAGIDSVAPTERSVPKHPASLDAKSIAGRLLGIRSLQGGQKRLFWCATESLQIVKRFRRFQPATKYTTPMKCSSSSHYGSTRRTFALLAFTAIGVLTILNSQAALITSGTVYVDIDARDLSLSNGADVSTWTNNGTGTIPDFTAVGSVRPTFSTNVGGVGAVTFDGTEDRMETFSTGATSDILGNGTWSVEAWVFSPTAVPAEQVVMSWAARDNGVNATAQLNYGSNGAYGALTHFGDGDMGYSGGAPAAGSWHFIAATYDGTTQRLYLDGALNSTNTPAGGLALTDPFDQHFIIGSAYDLPTTTHGFFYNGSLGQLTVNGGVLSDSDISHNFNENATYYGVPEPSTAALVLLASMSAFLIRRKRSSHQAQPHLVA